MTDRLRAEVDRDRYRRRNRQCSGARPGKLDRTPVAIVRGVEAAGEGRAQHLVMPPTATSSPRDGRNLCVDAGLVLRTSCLSACAKRRIADDVFELDLRGIEQLQAKVVVAIRAVRIRPETKKPRSFAGRRFVDILHDREVDVGVGDVGMPREQVAHLLLQGAGPVPPSQPQKPSERGLSRSAVTASPSTGADSPGSIDSPTFA